ncbi:hypothetical protein GCM10010912_16640 [Paenibacillus albidus]|uniref:Uncharacterized protein n=1 Tax=Paenibacillus albidus TaxID=2041023 RepID=A0A917C646_9BACL|nr:hypothetical protein [Paenibacillus albidus]GGF72200.1 hypothetical protein GCM10010912_16640 [Paenibacillus albidus]
MPNEQGRYNKSEVLKSALPYFIPRSNRWEGKLYSFAVLLTMTRCKKLGVPILSRESEAPSAFLYSANAGAGISDNQHRYIALYDRTDAYESIMTSYGPMKS